MRDQNVVNPLFTPSPASSPGTYNALSHRLSLDCRADSYEDIYDCPSPRTPETPPALPPKQRSLKKGLFLRSASADVRSVPSSPFGPASMSRYASLGDDNKVSLASIEAPNEEEFVGTLIEKSSKSDKLEKRLSKKGKQKQIKVEKREGSLKRGSNLEKTSSLPRLSSTVKNNSLSRSFNDEATIRSASLALRDDWDEIENMMMDLQCDINDTQMSLKGPTLEIKEPQLEDWLKKLDLEELLSVLILNGWDNISFINGVIDKHDISDLGVNNEKIKKKLLTSIETELQVAIPHKMPSSVEEWLNSIDLAMYLVKFNTNQMGTLARVLEIWDVELTTTLNIEPIGHRKRIMKSILDLRKMQSKKEEDEVKKEKAKRKEMKCFHKDEDLIRGVDYAVRYLGCSKVEGQVNSKIASSLCKQQQNKTKSNQKLPEYRLRIAAAGITFIDKSTQQTISQYNIQDISFVSRDKTDLLIFCFVTFDRLAKIKLCHVFRALTRNQALETCATIAQTFEMAYRSKSN